jgi:hypothetical protein
MPPAGFEPAIPVSERPKTHALDRAATGIGGNILIIYYYYYIIIIIFIVVAAAAVPVV